MIYRKDVILLALILLWGAYTFFGVEPMSANSHEMIVNYTIGTTVLAVVLAVLLIIMTKVSRFCSWMHTPVFGKKEKQKEQATLKDKFAFTLRNCLMADSELTEKQADIFTDAYAEDLYKVAVGKLDPSIDEEDLEEYLNEVKNRYRETILTKNGDREEKK